MEFNFSPSSRWAAYSFNGYREGMRPRELRSAPMIKVTSARERLQMDVQVRTEDLPDAIAELALTAVIEEHSGLKSYWALNHRADKPDFHDTHGFALHLT
jgi:hypothetical protein